MNWDRWACVARAARAEGDSLMVAPFVMESSPASLRLPAADRRRRIAAILQDYATFQLTARETVGFGDLARLDVDATP